MTEYNCNICDYFTNDVSNFKRHNKTKKHIKKSLHDIPIKLTTKIPILKRDMGPNNLMRNAEKRRETPKNAKVVRFECAHCKVTFTRSHGLSKHLNKCSMRDNSISKLEEQLKQTKKELNDNKTEKEYYKRLIDNYSIMGPKTFTSLTYIMHNYSKAPHIEKIEPRMIDDFKDMGDNIIENIISDYKNKRLVTTLVNVITKMHSKDNPENQSIWSTDTSRYNYIIKELLENEDSYWIIDKRGIKSKTYLIEPILNFIKKELKEYNKRMYKTIDQLSKERRSIILETQKYLCEMIEDIENGFMSQEIVKKLAKNLYHKTSDIPLIEEID